MNTVGEAGPGRQARRESRTERIARTGCVDGLDLDCGKHLTINRIALAVYNVDTFPTACHND